MLATDSTDGTEPGRIGSVCEVLLEAFSTDGTEPGRIGSEIFHSTGDNDELPSFSSLVDELQNQAVAIHSATRSAHECRDPVSRTDKILPYGDSQSATSEDNLGPPTSPSSEKGLVIKFSHQPYGSINPTLRTTLYRSGGFVSKLKIRAAGLNKETSHDLGKLLRSENTKCDSINLSGNRNIDCKEVLEISKQISAKALNLGDCNISATDLLILREYKFDKLNLSHNNLGAPDITEALKEIVESGLHTLVLADCNLQPGQAASILSNVHRKMEKIDLTHNSELAKQDYEALGHLASQYGIEELTLRGCEIDDQLLGTFSDSLDDGAKIGKLDISLSETISPEGMSSVANIVEKCGVTSLDLSACELTDDHLETLSTNGKQSQVEKLHLQDNPGLDASLLMTLVTLWGVTHLDASECRLNGSDVRTMVQRLELHEHRFEELDLSEPEELLTHDMSKEFARLLPYVGQTLWLCYGDIPCECRRHLEECSPKDGKNVSVKFNRNLKEQ